MWIQVLISIFIFFVLLRLYINVREHKISLKTSLAWLIIWLSVLTVFWSPELASRLAIIFGIGRGSDLIVYIAIIVIIFLLYRVFVQIEKINSDISHIIRDIATRHDEYKKKDSDPHS